MKKPKKELEVHTERPRYDSEGNIFHDFFVFYKEDDKKIDGVEIQVGSDDEGTFNSDGNGDISKGHTKARGYKDGRPVAHFQYMPKTEGERTITLKANGETKTFTLKGYYYIEK